MSQNPSSCVRPTIVCLCGSTRFREVFEQANKDETLKGNIVLSVGMFGHQEGLDMNGPVKQSLDQLHFRKIDVADEILVLNVGGYIGDSTRNEIKYATQNQKKIRYLEPFWQSYTISPTDDDVKIFIERINRLYQDSRFSSDYLVSEARDWFYRLQHGLQLFK